MMIVGAVAADGEAEGFWFEVARAGLGVVAVAFLGGGAAAAFGAREAERAQKRREDEYRAGFVGDLWDAYHEIKAVRRTLRAAGLATAQAALTATQAEVYEQQMGVLDDAQLALEKLLRTVRREREVFRPDLVYALRSGQHDRACDPNIGTSPPADDATARSRRFHRCASAHRSGGERR
jgi:hypothetical protein